MENKEDSVQCSTCGKAHTNIFSLESNQAYGCASDLMEKDGKIVSFSHYGSGFDTMKHIFNALGKYKIGVICDNCISEAVNSSIAVEDNDYDYWAPLTELQEIQHEEIKKFKIEFLKENND
jgi:hypothetical protein